MIEDIIDELYLQGYSLPKPLNISGKILSFSEVLEAMLPNNSTLEVASILDIPYSTLNAHLSRYYRKIFVDKPTGQLTWGRYYISKLGLLVCTKCNQIKEFECFSTCVGKFLNKRTHCISCCSITNKHYYENNTESCNDRSKQHYLNNTNMYIEKSARRRASKLRATPKWADLDKIKEKYLNRPDGFHVDHEIPLISTLVCGLHVHNNLQYLTAKQNLEKGNKFNIT